MKRLAAHVRRRLARHAELKQDLAVERELAHEVPAIIGQEHRVVGRPAAVSRDIPNLGPRVSIVDHQGKLIGRFGVVIRRDPTLFFVGLRRWASPARRAKLTITY